MYAPKLQPYSAAERWKMGFEHRIDAKADAIREECEAMLLKAREDLGIVEKKTADGVITASMIAEWMRPVNYQDMLRQQAGAMNSYPLGAYNAGMGQIGGGIAEAFGLSMPIPGWMR